jgi:hypothetical protein
MDVAREEMRVANVGADLGVTGRGVLVALMDRGIDWRNDDFRHADGSTRIESIFDLTDDRGAKSPANKWRMGTIYTRKEIDASLKSGKNLARGTLWATGRPPPASRAAAGVTVRAVSTGDRSRRNDPGRDNDRRRWQVPVGTIWDGASARNNICPGDYVIRTEWTDIHGVARSHATEGSVGEIWEGSSVGPTADGRIGIDFCAPGDSVFTTYNPRSW